MAQGLGEYGSLVDRNSSGLATSLSNFLAYAEDAIRNPTPKTWLSLGVFLFVLWFLFLRRRR